MDTVSTVISSTEEWEDTLGVYRPKDGKSHLPDATARAIDQSSLQVYQIGEGVFSEQNAYTSRAKVTPDRYHVDALEAGYTQALYYPRNGETPASSQQLEQRSHGTHFVPQQEAVATLLGELSSTFSAATRADLQNITFDLTARGDVDRLQAVGSVISEALNELQQDNHTLFNRVFCPLHTAQFLLDEPLAIGNKHMRHYQETLRKLLDETKQDISDCIKSTVAALQKLGFVITYNPGRLVLYDDSQFVHATHTVSDAEDYSTLHFRKPAYSKKS